MFPDLDRSRLKVYLMLSLFRFDGASVLQSFGLPRPLKRRIRSPKRKELPLTAMLETSVPFFGQSALAINRVRLAENGVLPKSDICLWKVAKILHFLATFLSSSLQFCEPF